MSADNDCTVWVVDPISVTLNSATGSITLYECTGDEMAAMLTISATTWRIVVREVTRAQHEAALAKLEGRTAA